MRSHDVESYWWEDPKSQRLPNLKADETPPPPADQPTQSKPEDKPKDAPKGKGEQ